MRYEKSDLNDFQVIPEESIVQLRIVSIEEKCDPRLHEDFEVEVVGPGQYEGQTFRPRLYLGSEEDPRGESPDTRKNNPKTKWAWKKWGRLLRAAGVPVMGDTEEEGRLLVGKEFLNQVNEREYERRDGKGKGHANDFGFNFFQVGTRDLHIATPKAESAGVQKAAPASSTPTATTERCAQCNTDIPASLMKQHARSHASHANGSLREEA